ncbi:carboxypeptidase Q-like [Centruroides sculpturatus]|uniref:carboxypeptidase Q-like n=2 Tax=Centruroides sculpturatus TaxID=218467 RepID=UPI000C6DCDBF|nr:carboxypeptidase Q-like [Centruroides sculpturatus]
MKGKYSFGLFVIILVVFIDCSALKCTLSPNLEKEIDNYKNIVDKIINYVISGPAKGQTYDHLAKFIDKFGNRIAGSENLENAIDYMIKTLRGLNLNVRTENVQVPHWVRGEESAQLLQPRRKNMAILGLGGSIGTGENGITAEVIAVKSFDELKSKAAQVKGKIVVYNQDFVSYSKSVQYRDYGAEWAAKFGGVASLIRSIAPFSIYSPHTGWQDYSNNVTKIPTACITIEDAEMIYRMAKRGTKVVIHLKMSAKNLPPVKSRNTIVEMKGQTFPQQIVLVSGHLDSWDVGEGAMDDGAGAFISWRVLDILTRLKLKPKRTLRAVLWTGEEEGLFGAITHLNNNKKNLKNFSVVMESDIGTFKPLGLTYSGNNTIAQCIMQEILKLMSPINATQLNLMEEGSDTTVFMNAGVPGISLVNANEKYFYFHHSNGDTMTVEDPENLDLCTALWTASAYVLADIQEMLPR